MKKTFTVVGLFLLVALTAGGLLYGRWRSGIGEAPPADPQAASSPAAEEATAAPSPTPPAGPRADFARPDVTPPPEQPRPPRSARPRRPRTPGKAAPGAGAVQAQSTAPGLGEYLRELAAEIRDQWDVPRSARGRNVSIPVVLKIARDGRVLWTLVSGSSGDTAIDESVATMIENLERDGLPPLPDHYPYDELDVGLALHPGVAR